MASKSPFARMLLKVRFVRSPEPDAPQHIFIHHDGRAERSLCGKTDHEIHHNDTDTPDVTVSKDRHPERPVCPTCEIKWKRHPNSPWKLWGGGSTWRLAWRTV